MLRMLKGIIFLSLSFIMLFYTCAFADTLSNVSVNSAPLVTQSSAVDMVWYVCIYRHWGVRHL